MTEIVPTHIEIKIRQAVLNSLGGVYKELKWKVELLSTLNIFIGPEIKAHIRQLSALRILNKGFS